MHPLLEQIVAKLLDHLYTFSLNWKSVAKTLGMHLDTNILISL